jgi:hypothetical protein
MGFGEQWRLLSRVNLSCTETSLGLIPEGLAPLLIDPPILLSIKLIQAFHKELVTFVGTAAWTDASRL